VDHLLSQRRASPHYGTELSRHLPPAAGLHTAAPEEAPSALALNDLERRRSARFWTTSRRTVAILREREMPGSRRSTLLPVRRPPGARAQRRHPAGPGDAGQEVRSLARATSCPDPRSTHFSKLPDTATWSGRRDRTMPPRGLCRPDCAYPSWSGSAYRTWSSDGVRTSSASQGPQGTLHACARRPSRSSEHGYANAPPPRPSPLSQTRGAVSSVATVSSTCSRSTCRPPGSDARRQGEARVSARASPLERQWICLKPASTAP